MLLCILNRRHHGEAAHSAARWVARATTTPYTLRLVSMEFCHSFINILFCWCDRIFIKREVRVSWDVKWVSAMGLLIRWLPWNLEQKLGTTSYGLQNLSLDISFHAHVCRKQVNSLFIDEKLIFFQYFSYDSYFRNNRKFFTS